MMKQSIEVGLRHLTIEDVIQAATDEAFQLGISDESWKEIHKSRELVEKWASERRVIYGMTTGLGELIVKLVPPQFASRLSSNILRSHAAGVGDILPVPIIRAIMLLRINCLAKGASGVSEETLSTLIQMFNRRVYPRMRAQGSVGASGDLAPLAHLGLAAMGEGDVIHDNQVKSASIALEQAGIRPVTPGYKEGLAIINGTSGMTAIGAFVTHGAIRLLKTAQVATALSLEVLRASTRPFDAEGHALRPHPGQIAVAKNIRRLLDGSSLVVEDAEITRILEGQISSTSVNTGSIYRQNAYSLRCIPQILGPVWEAIRYVSDIVETEINSIDDNPLVLLEEEDIFHGGNFHGQPVAMSMDFMKIALTEIGNVSERRFERFINTHTNNGLPAFLSGGEPGLEAGFEGVQYAATSLLAECRSIATPVSIQSISANAGFQDVVSMGMIASRQALEILRNVEYIIGLEILAGVQAADFAGPGKLGLASRSVYELVRQHLSFMEADRPMYYDLDIAKNLVSSGEILGAVEATIGGLD